jgi:hypothetical protein
MDFFDRLEKYAAYALLGLMGIIVLSGAFLSASRICSIFSVCS